MRALEFITGHVIYNLAYTYKFQLKTTYVIYCVLNITAISCPSFQSHFLIHLHFNEVHIWGSPLAFFRKGWSI